MTPPLPELWQAEAQAQLSPGEAVLAWLETDLDAHLRFSRGLLLLTDRRLLAREAGGVWRTWTWHQSLKLERRDHAGVGHLELTDEASLLAAWRYTLGLDESARRLAQCFLERNAASSGGREPEPCAVENCPGCGQPLPAGRALCSACTLEANRPPSTWTLLRLWRFARPYRNQLIAGFLLTLASTAATLVPPYLNMPLMDDVLIPFQNGTPIDPGRVKFYLGGLLAAALAAWALGWGKTYILARVSERIGADLRIATYQHLQTLSLEYFGGKRTGDLVARIGTETDRINVFLSLHLLDFATDLLMIGMTAAILLSINPWLALVTLLPLPFIIWMIHVVRDRLRHGFEQADRVWSEITSVLTDTIPGIRVVKAFAQEKREVQRFSDANARNLAVNDRVKPSGRFSHPASHC